VLGRQPHPSDALVRPSSPGPSSRPESFMCVKHSGGAVPYRLTCPVIRNMRSIFLNITAIGSLFLRQRRPPHRCCAVNITVFLSGEKSLISNKVWASSPKSRALGMEFLPVGLLSARVQKTRTALKRNNRTQHYFHVTVFVLVELQSTAIRGESCLSIAQPSPLCRSVP
jgi:hypothetical protein